MRKITMIAAASMLPFLGFSQKVQIWMTKGDQSQLMQKQTDVNFTAVTGSLSNTTTIDTATKYQEIDGFGGAITGSSAYVIDQMGAAARENVMNDLFSKDGIRINFVRHTVGASDFNFKNFYSYCDEANDTDLSSFSIDEDKDYIIPVIKEAIAKNDHSGIRIMGSPWSAPKWMKNNNAWGGGSLQSQYEDIYADYLVKYVQAYEAEGIPIYAITMQNEPLHEDSQYPTMKMTESQSIRWVKNDLGPKFSSANLDTKIITFDHNWSDNNYPITVLNDAGAKQYLAGSAFHAYCGGCSAANQTTLHNAHPDKGIWFTEQTAHGADEGNYDFGADLDWSVENLFINGVRNWSKAVLQWNVVLNNNFGPWRGNCNNCRGLITVRPNDTYYKEAEYYAVGHFSRFVDQGAHRIESNELGSGLKSAAFQNPDGSIVLVVLANWNSNGGSFTVRMGNSYFPYTLGRRSLVTFKWYPTGFMDCDELGSDDAGCPTTTCLPDINQDYSIDGSAFTSGSSLSVCSGQDVILGFEGSGYADWTFDWTAPGGGTVSRTGNSNSDQLSLSNVTSSNGGTYQVNYTDPNSCSRSKSFSLSVSESPNGTLSKSNATDGASNGSITITFTDTPARGSVNFSLDGGSTYEGNVSDNTGSVTYSNLAPKTYDVYAKWGNGECPISLGPVVVGNDITTSIDGIDASQNPVLYPNPVIDILKISDLPEGASVEIYAMDGTLIETIITNTEDTQVNLQDIPDGMYLVSVNSENYNWVGKFVKAQ